jgi:hypothetical protein
VAGVIVVPSIQKVKASSLLSIFNETNTRGGPLIRKWGIWKVGIFNNIDLELNLLSRLGNAVESVGNNGQNTFSISGKKVSSHFPL